MIAIMIIMMILILIIWLMYHCYGVRRRHGVESALLDGRVCFPWAGAPEGPALHGASKVV